MVSSNINTILTSCNSNQNRDLKCNRNNYQYLHLALSSFLQSLTFFKLMILLFDSIVSLVLCPVMDTIAANYISYFWLIYVLRL